MKLSIIIPAHNEEENIAEVITRIESCLDLPHELVVVNDHSTDRTELIIEEMSKKYPAVRLANNTYKKGFANAIRFGFKQAKNDVVVPVMGDLCDDLGTIKKMLVKIQEGFDVVCAARYIKGGKRIGGSRIKGFFSFFVGWSLHYLLGIPTHDIANAFKMYRKTVLDSIKTQAHGFELSMELSLKAYYSGFKITEIATVWKEREQGKSSFKMMKLLPNYLKFYLWGITKRLNSKV
jgi:glycosyltransferase involved in cell wall biosynthesis